MHSSKPFGMANAHCCHPGAAGLVPAVAVASCWWRPFSWQWASVCLEFMRASRCVGASVLLSDHPNHSQGPSNWPLKPQEPLTPAPRVPAPMPLPLPICTHPGPAHMQTHYFNNTLALELPENATAEIVASECVDIRLPPPPPLAA